MSLRNKIVVVREDFTLMIIQNYGDHDGTKIFSFTDTSDGFYATEFNSNLEANSAIQAYQDKHGYDHLLRVLDFNP